MVIPRRITKLIPTDIQAKQLPATDDIKTLFIRLASGVVRFGIAIRDAARWIYNAPSALLQLLKHVVQRVISIALFTGKIVLFSLAGSLAFVATLALLRLAFNAYRLRRKKLQLQHLEQDRMRNRLLAEVLHQEREEAWQRSLQERRRREQEADRRRAEEQALKQEQARKAESYARAQREEQCKRQDNAQRAQQKLEDRRLYHRWRAACDVVFGAGSGSLPEPPSWPCSQASCQLKRRLKACPHNLERLFSANGNLQQTLQDERKRWHPNRPIFHKLRSDSAEKMATEISQVIQSLMR